MSAARDNSSWLVDVALMLGLVGVILWALPDLVAWSRGLPPVQTSGPAARWNCQPPTEHEQLLISVVIREGRPVVTGCTYVAPKGTMPRVRGTRS